MADSDLRLTEQPKKEAPKYFIKPELFPHWHTYPTA